MAHLLRNISNIRLAMVFSPYYQWYKDNTFYKYKNHVIFYDAKNALNIHIVMSRLHYSGLTLNYGGNWH